MKYRHKESKRLQIFITFNDNILFFILTILHGPLSIALYTGTRSFSSWSRRRKLWSEPQSGCHRPRGRDNNGVRGKRMIFLAVRPCLLHCVLDIEGILALFLASSSVSFVEDHVKQFARIEISQHEVRGVRESVWPNGWLYMFSRRISWIVKVLWNSEAYQLVPVIPIVDLLTNQRWTKKPKWLKYHHTSLHSPSVLRILWSIVTCTYNLVYSLTPPLLNLLIDYLTVN